VRQHEFLYVVAVVMSDVDHLARRKPIFGFPKVPTMSAKQERIVFSTALRITRAFGWILIAIAVLGIPQMQFLIGRLAISFGLLSSIMLGLAGIAWIVAVKLFLLFFDRYLSRN
jgi:hypothetical protein